MNYRKKKKLFQEFSFFKLERNSQFLMCFQANSINSLTRILLTKELNNLNFKLQIYQTKLLRQKKFIFEETFTKNVYSGLFLVFSTTSTNYVDKIQEFFKISKTFGFLLPICVIFLKRLFFNFQLQKFAQLPNINSFLIYVLLIRILLFINLLTLKLRT